LVDVLTEAAEPLRPKDVLRLAAEAGYTHGVLYRARKSLEGTVVDVGGRFSPDKHWALARREGAAPFDPSSGE
jgi:hypothetical protein